MFFKLPFQLFLNSKCFSSKISISISNTCWPSQQLAWEMKTRGRRKGDLMWLYRGRCTRSCVVSTLCGKRNKAGQERLRRHMRENKKGSEHLWNCYHNSFLACEFHFWGVFFSVPYHYNGLESADHWEFSFKKLIIEFGGKWDNFVFGSISIVINWKVLGIATCLIPSDFSLLKLPFNQTFILLCNFDNEAIGV